MKENVMIRRFIFFIKNWEELKLLKNILFILFDLRGSLLPFSEISPSFKKTISIQLSIPDTFGINVSTNGAMLLFGNTTFLATLIPSFSS